MCVSPGGDYEVWWDRKVLLYVDVTPPCPNLTHCHTYYDKLGAGCCIAGDTQECGQGRGAKGNGATMTSSPAGATQDITLIQQE